MLLWILLWLTYTTSIIVAGRKTGLCIREGHTGKHDISTKADSFKELMEDSSMFIDRSLLIRELMADPNQVILVACTKKWGKSVNLDMIKTFFEIEVDDHGHEILPKNVTRNHALFQSGHITWMKKTVARLQQPMLIARNETKLFNTFQGQNPVIFIDLKVITGDGFVDVYKSMTHTISRVYQQHHYMGHVLVHKTNHHNGTDEERERTQADLDQFNKFIFDEEINENVTCESIKFLCKLLYKHFNRKVYVLIDNYELPILRLFYDQNFIRLYSDDVLNFYTNLMRITLKGNEYLEKAVLTGALATCTEFVFESLENYVEYTVMHNPWAEYYGIDEETVNDLFHQIELPEDEHEDVHIWYGGYEMGTGVDLHNPWSVIGYINNRNLRNYWFSPDDTFFLLHVIAIYPIRDLIESLVELKNVSVHLHNVHFSMHDTLILRDIEKQQHDMKLQAKIIDLILGRLWASGHLTYVGASYENGKNITYLELPNYELIDEMICRLFWLYQFKDRISPLSMTAIMQHLLKFIYNEHETSKVLAHEMGNMLSLYDVYLPVSPKKAKEKGVQVNTRFARSFINYLALEFRHNQNFNVTTEFHPTENPNLIMHHGHTGVILKFLFDAVAGRLAWQKIKHYQTFFKNNSHIKTVKVIGIAISAKTYVDIFARTYTTEKINRRFF